MHTGCGSSNPIDGKQFSNGQGAAARRTWPARLPLTRDRYQPPQAPHTPRSGTTGRPPGCGGPDGHGPGRTGGGAAEPPYHPSRLANVGTAGQVIVVTAPSWRSTTATLRAYERDGEGGWREVIAATPARLGWSGLYLAAERRQGTGKTPAGTFAIPRAFGRLADPGTELPYRQFDRDDAWTYNPERPATYNVYQTSTCGLGAATAATPSTCGPTAASTTTWRSWTTTCREARSPRAPTACAEPPSPPTPGGRRHLPACHQRQGHGRLHRHPPAADARRAALARPGPQAGHRRRAGVRHHPHVTA